MRGYSIADRAQFRFDSANAATRMILGLMGARVQEWRDMASRRRRRDLDDQEFSFYGVRRTWRQWKLLHKKGQIDLTHELTSDWNRGQGKLLAVADRRADLRQFMSR